MNQWTTPLTAVKLLRFPRRPLACVVCFGHAKLKAQKMLGFWLVWNGCNALKSL
jgi:hypothetical protein